MSEWSPNAPAQLAVGEMVGDLRVTETGPDRLFLCAPRKIAFVSLVAGGALGAIAILCLVCGLLTPAGVLAASAAGIAYAAVETLRKSCSIDRVRGTIISRQDMSTTAIPLSIVRAIQLSVVHQGPYETLCLEVVKSDNTAARLLWAVTGERGARVAAAGAAMAAIAQVPLLRAGISQQPMPAQDAILEYATPAGLDAMTVDTMGVRINCPKCREQNVPAVAHVLSEHSVYGSLTTNWVRCSSCQADLYSTLPAEQLSGLSPQQLEPYLRVHVSLVARVMAVLAVVLCIMPFVGLIASGVSLALNARRSGWMRTCSIVSLAISLISSIFVLVVVQMSK